MHFRGIIPRLGEKYPVEIETISKPYQEYRTEEYAKLGLPWRRPSWWEMN